MLFPVIIAWDNDREVMTEWVIHANFLCPHKETTTLAE